jgi:hypothetical protein
MKRRTLLLAALGRGSRFRAGAQVKPSDRRTWRLLRRRPRAEAVEGAKKEGELNIYTSAQSDDMGALVQAFEKKYGIKVSVWRSSSEKVLQRACRRPRGNRHTMDVAETNGPELEAMSREKILQTVKSPLPAGPHRAGDPPARRMGRHAPERLRAGVQHQLVKKEELPKTWEDLANPKWKGKLGIEQEDSDWLAGQFAELGEARADEGLQATSSPANGVSVRKGHTLLTQLVVSGEIPARAHGLQLQGRAAEGEGRADRLVHHRPGDRAAQRRGRWRRTRRTRTRRCSSTTSRSAPRARRSSPGATSCRPAEGRHAAQQDPDEVRRRARGARRVPEVGEALREPVHERAARWARNRTTAARRTASSSAASRASTASRTSSRACARCRA